MSTLDYINDEDDANSSSGGKGGFLPSKNAGSDFWIPSFYELNQIGKDEVVNKALAEDALFNNRISIRAHTKAEVTALTKAQEFKQKHTNSFENDAPEGGGGLGLDSHPELPDMGGKADPNHIILPESEDIALNGQAKNDLKLQHKLNQKAAAKFGMGSIGSLSKEALEQEYKKKMRARVESPKNSPRFKAQNTPKYTPM